MSKTEYDQDPYSRTYGCSIINGKGDKTKRNHNEPQVPTSKLQRNEQEFNNGLVYPNQNTDSDNSNMLGPNINLANFEVKYVYDENGEIKTITYTKIS